MHPTSPTVMFVLTALKMGRRYDALCRLIANVEEEAALEGIRVRLPRPPRPVEVLNLHQPL